MKSHFVPFVNELFDGRYLVNFDGEVQRAMPSKFHKNNYIKPFINKYGYVEYSLNDKDNKRRHIQAHRIVAIMFIDNPFNKKYVNHLDGNKLNNNVSNLEWCTASENEKHSYRVLGKINPKPSFGKIGYNYTKGEHSVGQYDISNNLIKVWFSPSVAEIEGGFSLKQISAVCNGLQKTHRGFIWKYVSQTK